MRTDLIVALYVVFSCLARSQGAFVFANLLPQNGIDAPVFDSSGNRLSGSGYLAMLYAGPTSDSLRPVVLLSNGSIAVQPFQIGAGAGYIVSQIVSAENVGLGALAWVEMRAWDARLGATYDEARQLGLGGYGQSTLFQARAGTDSGVGPIPAALVGLQSFSLLPVVPEPSAFSLLVLSLPLVWLAGRKTRQSRPSDES